MEQDAPLFSKKKSSKAKGGGVKGSTDKLPESDWPSPVKAGAPVAA